VAVVFTVVQTKEIRINIHKQNNTKHSTNNTKHSKCKYTYYQNTHTVKETIYSEHPTAKNYLPAVLLTAGYCLLRHHAM
jgi:hypothetical protein